MGAGKQKAAQDSANAARMKEQGIERTSGRCPMCHNSVPLRGMENHIRQCQGKRGH